MSEYVYTGLVFRFRVHVYIHTCICIIYLVSDLRLVGNKEVQYTILGSYRDDTMCT